MLQVEEINNSRMLYFILVDNNKKLTFPMCSTFIQAVEAVEAIKTILTSRYKRIITL